MDVRKPPGQDLEEGIRLIELGFELLGTASRTRR